MAKVFMITAGCYSDYHIVGAFSTRELAQMFIDAHAVDDADASIEEYELDADEPQLRAGLKLYAVRMKPDGEGSVACAAGGYHEPGRVFWFIQHDRSYILYMVVWATDGNHAVKIVNEKRAQFVALNQWGPQA